MDQRIYGLNSQTTGVNGVHGDCHLHGTAPNPQHVSEQDPVDTPVLIIGGGPTGLLLCYILSQLGLKSTIIERYPERLGAPKAHALSPRSLEICRQCGLDVRKIRKLGTCRADAYWVNFVTTLSGEAVGVLPYERMDPEVLDETPEMIHNIPQPVFEQFLTDSMAQNPNVDIRKGISFDSLELGKDSVLTTVHDRASDRKYQIRSRHVVGCDGAKSRVREFLRIESDGEDGYETLMTIHINANLRPILEKRVGMLHWIMDPGASGFFIGYDLDGNTVFISPFDPDKHPVQTWNETLCRSVVKAGIGSDIPFDILSYRPWVLSRKVAKSYRMGNVFLAGDAAHSFPPTGGLGLNSGLADVHNLAYKIAGVHQGWAADKVLDAYQSERQHVAEVNSRQSVKNGIAILGLLKILGTAGEGNIETARENLFAALRDPKKKKKIDEGIEAQREHFDNLELHLGYVYGSTETPPSASNYTPKYISGARLPHAWITMHSPLANQFPPVDVSYVTELSAEEVAQRRFSTLDLCASDAFTFLVASHASWDEHVQQVRSRYGQALKVNMYVLNDDFDLVPGLRASAWIESAGLREGGGLLVRPDQHIQMRLRANTSLEEILSSLKNHLGK